MDESKETPRRPANADDKSKGRTNAPTSGHAPRPDSRAGNTDGQRRGGDRPREGGTGYGRGPRPQGSGGPGARPARPQGQSTHSSGPRDGARPQGSGGYGGRPRAPAGQTGGYQSRPAGTGSPRPAGAPSYKPASESSEDSDDKPRVPKKPDTNYSMSYRGSSQRANSRGPSSPNRQTKRGNQGQRPKEASKRQPMLNTHKIAPFKYDMNEILSQSSMDPSMASSFLASVIAKASRVSARDAKDYMKTFEEEGNLTKDECEKLCRLLDRYSKYR